MPYYEFGKAYNSFSGECGTVDQLGLEMATGDNGNYGGFVANPCFLTEKNKNYQTMLDNYYTILNMVRNGVKLRKVTTKEGEIIFTENIEAFKFVQSCPEGGGSAFNGGTEPDTLYGYAAYNAANFSSTEIESVRGETERVYRSSENITEDYIVLVENFDYFLNLTKYLDDTSYSQASSETIGGTDHTKWATYCAVVDDCIGKINIPAYIYNKHIKAPKSMPCADVATYIKWLEDNQNLSGDCCNLRLWEDMGGQEMLTFLNGHKNDCQNQMNKLNGLHYAVPGIETNILLTQNYTDVGVLTNVDGNVYESGLTGPSYDGTDGSRPHGKLMESALGSGFTKVVLEDGTEITAQEQINRFAISGQGISIDQIIMGKKTINLPTTERYDEMLSALEMGTITELPEDCKLPPIEVESLLHTLASSKKFLDDNNNVLPGLFKTFSNTAGQMFICTKSGDDWTMTQINSLPKNAKNGDGLLSETPGVKIYGSPTQSSDGQYYRTITIAAAGIEIAKAEEIEKGARDGVPDYVEPDGTHYYFFVKYDNSEDTLMEMPYATGNTTNVYYSGDTVYRGDFITEVNIDGAEGTVEFKYVIGGYFYGDINGKYISYKDGGDTYYEKYNIDLKHVDYVPLDGVDNVPVWSKYIDFEGAAKEFYSSRYGLYRTGNTANIIQFTSGELWDKERFSETFAAYDAYLTKEEYLTNFSLPPKTDVNVTIDRGGVSIFEKHYKLSECNTMQDLMQYNNGELFPD